MPTIGPVLSLKETPPLLSNGIANTAFPFYRQGDWGSGMLAIAQGYTGWQNADTKAQSFKSKGFVIT